jgi:hypothetical protein
MLVQAKVSKSLSQKQNKNKRARYITQVVEHFPSKCETLDSISITAKRKIIKFDRNIVGGE